MGLSSHSLGCVMLRFPSGGVLVPCLQRASKHQRRWKKQEVAAEVAALQSSAKRLLFSGQPQLPERGLHAKSRRPGQRQRIMVTPRAWQWQLHYPIQRLNLAMADAACGRLFDGGLMGSTAVSSSTCVS